MREVGAKSASASRPTAVSIHRFGTARPGRSHSAPIAFAVRKENPKLKAALDAWVQKVYRGVEYNMLRKRCFENKGALTEARELSTDKTGHISTFDPLIQKYSTVYGFDWRLMSAQATAYVVAAVRIREAPEARTLDQCRQVSDSGPWNKSCRAICCAGPRQGCTRCYLPALK